MSRPGSPIVPQGPTSSTITLIQPPSSIKAVNSRNNTLNSFYYQSYHNYLNPATSSNGTLNNNANNKKQFIKLQDCTTWLTLANKQNFFNNSHNQLINNNRFKNFTCNSYNDNANLVIDKTMPQFPGAKLIDTNLNRINILLNRRSNRVNTYKFRC